MYRIIVQLVIAGSRVLARGFTKAFRQELEAARTAAQKRPADVPPPVLNQSMPLEEAMKILNVDSLDPEVIEKNYKHLFEVNDKKNGGSFYLQSKVYRAKERINQELKGETPSAT